MTDSASDKANIGGLILGPALITFSITILRLEGELHHWGSPWFYTSAGGDGAIVGISWLPIIFGPYFALKLANAGEAPVNYRKAFGSTIGALAVIILGGILVAVTRIASRRADSGGLCEYAGRSIYSSDRLAFSGRHFALLRLLSPDTRACSNVPGLKRPLGHSLRRRSRTLPRLSLVEEVL